MRQRYTPDWCVFYRACSDNKQTLCRHGPWSCLLSPLSSCAGQLNRAGQPGQELTSTTDTRDHEICEGHWLCHQVGTTHRKQKSSCEGRSQHVPFSRSGSACFFLLLPGTGHGEEMKVLLHCSEEKTTGENAKCSNG